MKSITEAAIHPNRELLRKIKELLEWMFEQSYVEEQKKKSAAIDDTDADSAMLIRLFGGKDKLASHMSERLWWDDFLESFSTLNDELASEKIEFVFSSTLHQARVPVGKNAPPMDPKKKTIAVYIPENNGILVVLDYLFNVRGRMEELHDPKVSRTINAMVSFIGHELVHREQYNRAKISDSKPRWRTDLVSPRYANSKKDSVYRATSKYRNLQPEVAAWAYTLVSQAFNTGKFKDRASAAKWLRQFARNTLTTKKEINYYTPENKKRLLRLMVDYVRDLLSRKQ